MTSDPGPKPISVINVEELVKRIQQAKQLRGEGAPEEDIKAVEPSQEEMREALLALRGDRREIAAAATKKKSSKKATPKSLDDLLKPIGE